MNDFNRPTFILNAKMGQLAAPCLNANYQALYLTRQKYYYLSENHHAHLSARGKLEDFCSATLNYGALGQ